MRVSRKWKTVDVLNDYTVRLDNEEADILVAILSDYLFGNSGGLSPNFARCLRDDLVSLRDKAGLW